MRIMIDGYNLSLHKGTGVSTYARNLSYSLKDMGFEVSVLYGLPDSLSTDKDDLLREIAFYESGEAVPLAYERLLKKIKRTVRAALTPIRGARATEISIKGSVVAKQFSSKMPAFDDIYNCADLFLISRLYFKLTGKLLKIKLANPPDVMHWTYPIPAWVVGSKNIYTMHDLVPLRLPYTTLDDKRFYLNKCRKIAEHADQIVTVSDFSKKDICALLGLSESKVINTYQAVSIPEQYKKASDTELSTTLGNLFDLELDKYILFVGAIEPKKNVGRMLEAYLGSNISLPLVMVGPEAWMADKELQLLDSAGNKYMCFDGNRIVSKSRVRRLNYVSFSVLMKLVKGAKFLVFPSLYEGFGLPVLEAMSLGTPVLTSKESSIPEVAGDAAVLVDPYDVEEIRNSMIRMTDEDMKDHAALGLQQAEKFSSGNIEIVLRQLYEGLV